MKSEYDASMPPPTPDADQVNRSAGRQPKPKPRSRRNYAQELADLQSRVWTAIAILEVVAESNPPGCEALVSKTIRVLKGNP